MLQEVAVESQSIFKFNVYGDGEEFLVDLNEKTCTCNKFTFDGLPCSHALAAIRSRGNNLYVYCSYYYKLSAFKKAYVHPIYLVGNICDWNLPEEIKNRSVDPPIPAPPSGRPKKCGIPSKGELEGKNVNSCGRCKQFGHNHRTCRNPIATSSRSNQQGEDRRPSLSSRTTAASRVSGSAVLS